MNGCVWVSLSTVYVLLILYYRFFLRFSSFYLIDIMKDMSTRLTEKKVARERAFEMKMKAEKEAWEAILAKVHHQFIVYSVYFICAGGLGSVCSVYSVSKIQCEVFNIFQLSNKITFIPF